MRNVLALLCCLLLAACSQPEMPLRIGTNVWPGYEPLYLARSLQLLSPQDARLVEYTSATQVMEAFKDGAIEAAALTLDEALLLQQNGVDVRVVLVMDYSQGADVLLSRSQIGSLAALKGRRVGVEDTALGAYMLDRALDNAGLHYDEVKVVPMDVHEHEQAYLDGQVDAVVTFDPVASRLLAQGAHKLFDSARIPGEIVDVLVVRAGSKDAQVWQLRRVVRAWFKALAFIDQHPQEAAQRMAPRMQLDVAQTQEAFRGVHLPTPGENHAQLLSRPSPLGVQAQKLAQTMMDHRLAAAGLRPEALLDTQLLRELY